MNIPQGLYFTKEHEWVKIDGGAGTIGITDYAQHSLGDVTFVELPKTGAALKQFQIMATIESVKAASDIYAPVSGTITETNQELNANPALINQDCYAKGWIAKVKLADPGETGNLMDPDSYKTYVEGLA
ncbi:MAG: glycine cleavage system protein GcvH [Candidatus Omnitrophica bacterium]|nr:glycine cleavage system protein GcvH [Candidatus Omnitrophota bacterium]